MRILGLDYGQKRIGVAISDPTRIIAQPLPFILHNKKMWDEIKKLITEYQIGEIVVGYPRTLKGTPSAMTRQVEEFAKTLQEQCRLTIHFWDERLTTAESENILIQANVSRNKRKEVRDTMAAVLILQGYLQSKS